MQGKALWSPLVDGQATLLIDGGVICILSNRLDYHIKYHWQSVRIRRANCSHVFLNLHAAFVSCYILSPANSNIIIINIDVGLLKDLQYLLSSIVMEVHLGSIESGGFWTGMQVGGREKEWSKLLSRLGVSCIEYVLSGSRSKVFGMLMRMEVSSTINFISTKETYCSRYK